MSKSEKPIQQQILEHIAHISRQSAGSVHNDVFQYTFQKIEKLRALLKLIFQNKARILNLSEITIEPTVHISQHLKVKIMDLMVLVPLLNSTKNIRLLLILEHKSFQNAKELFKQLLYYISLLYDVYECAILPIVFYQGEDKNWKVSSSLHEHLRQMECFPEDLEDVFGENVPNFKYILFNLQKHDILKDVQDLTIRNDLFTLQQIWSLNKGEEERSKFLKNFCEGLATIPEAQRMLDIDVLTSYLCRFDPTLNIDRLRDIEKEYIKGGPHFMGGFKTISEQAKEQGIQQGVQQGIQQGVQQVALNLIKDNLSLQKIRALTGLSEQQILYLKNKGH